MLLAEGSCSDRGLILQSIWYRVWSVRVGGTQECLSLYEVESMKDSVYRDSSLMSFVLRGLNLTRLQAGM